MLMLTLLAVTATADYVTIGAALRIGLYGIPLALLLTTSRPRHLPFLKAALAGYAIVAVVTLAGGSRSLGSVISLVPAVLLAIHALRAGPHPRRQVTRTLK